MRRSCSNRAKPLPINETSGVPGRLNKTLKRCIRTQKVTVIAPQGPDEHDGMRNTPGIFGVLMIAKSVPVRKGEAHSGFL